MSCQLFVRPEVEADIAEAEVWYEQRVEGLGKDFTRARRDTLRELPGNPVDLSPAPSTAGDSLVLSAALSVSHRLSD